MRIILNPMARHGAGRRARALLERELTRRGLDFDIVQTEGPGHGAELARAAADAGVERVVAAGGDGTVHEVANGLMSATSAGTTLGLIPIGTGNDFVKMVPGTRTQAEAIATLAGDHTMGMDVGVASWNGSREYFVNAMGSGIDVEVVRQMRRSRFLPGGAIYIAALLRALARYRALALRITIDGSEFHRRIMILAVCNGPSVGGSFRICPDARPDDGAFDICVVGDLPNRRKLDIARRVMAGTHAGADGVTMLRGGEVLLHQETAEPLFFQLDGELRQAVSGGVRVGLAPRRLQVLAAAQER